MLLIIEALLIVAALGQDRRAAIEETIYPLDMADNSVDDQYDGCTKEMEELVESQYLEKELKNTPSFRNVWTAEAKKLKDSKYLTAIYAYTQDEIYKEFNKAVRTERKKYTDKNFKWYSLHFLLTKALQMLKKKQTKNYTVYRGTKSKFKGKEGMTFRFGSFASFSRSRNVARGFANKGRGTCFELKDYKGAHVATYSEYPGEEEVLIPPYEKFKVTDVKTNDWCKTVFVLISTGEKSDLNCALFNKSFLSKLGCCGKR
ncbi:hypothetical protein PO909_020941 [Leuciscus waleckii]